jgi:hypothetical protein
MVVAAGSFDRSNAGTDDAWRRGVRGAITGRDVILHSLTILRCWGPTCYLRCLRAAVSRRPSTFLEVLYRDTPRGEQGEGMTWRG